MDMEFSWSYSCDSYPFCGHSEFIAHAYIILIGALKAYLGIERNSKI